MKKYYFLEITPMGLVAPLQGQTDEDGNPIDGGMMVKCDRDKREFYPAGTIFGTDELVDMGNDQYAAGDIYPLNVTDLLPADVATPVPMEIREAWKKFRDTLEYEPDMAWFKEDPVEKVKKKATPRKKTLIEELREACPCPDVTKDGFWVDPINWDTLLVNVRMCAPTLLVGPAGTGKTELAMYLGRRLGKEVKVYDMGSMHDPMTQLLGTHRLERDGDATRSVFEYASFVEDIQKPCIIVLDELSRAPLMTNNILFPCLDSRRELPVEMAGESERRRIKIHPECVFIATANIGAEYTGTMSLDKALVSRLFPVELDFMPMDEEVSFLMKVGEVGKPSAVNIVKTADRLRSMYRKGEISAEVSVRDTLRAARQVSFGRLVREAMEICFLPMFAREERQQVKRVFMTL